MTHLQDNVQLCNDLTALKQQVATRLSNVMQRLQNYKEQQNILSTDLLERFARLNAHAQQMEKESQSLSNQLENSVK